jgi:hypothetical protein
MTNDDFERLRIYAKPALYTFIIFLVVCIPLILSL